MPTFDRSEKSRVIAADKVGGKPLLPHDCRTISGAQSPNLLLGSWTLRPTLTLAVGLIAIGCSPEPSMEQTSAWLTERLPQYARVDWPGSFRPDLRANQLIYDVAIADCLLSFTVAVYDVMGMSGSDWSYNSFTRYRINLPAVDLKELAVVPESPSDNWQIRLVTIPESARDEFTWSHRSTGFGSQSASTDWSEYAMRSEVYLTVDSEENAETVSNAVHNLARQCGAKASPF